MSGVTVTFGIAAALKDAFAVNAALSAIDVISGPVAGERDPREWIQIGRPRVTRTPRTITGQPMGGHDEDGTVPVMVLASADGRGEEAIVRLRERMEELIGAVEAALAADFTLGGIVRWAYVSALAEQDQGIEPPPAAGHWMTVELTVSFAARVYPGVAT